jgi:hypothetical protein
MRGRNRGKRKEENKSMRGGKSLNRKFVGDYRE